MASPTRRAGRLALIAVTMMLYTSCTDARLQRTPIEEEEPLDNLLQIKGEFCTEPSAQVDFPLKVLFIFDQSASLQCTDSTNRRFEALNQSLDRLRRRPATEFAAIGFSSWSRVQNFTRDRASIDTLLGAESGLGPATDYQGSVATAVRLLEQDMREVGPAERARTRYVINFVSDGVPEPRCNPGCEDTISVCSDGEDNDGDGRSDGADPDCADIEDNSLHPDNLYGVCNTTQEVPDDLYVDMSGLCPEYNQPRQIQQRIQELMALKDAYSIGDITFNTVLLFSPQEVTESVCPGAGAQFGYRRDQARALLQNMANIGNGTFRDVNLADDVSDFLNFEVTSIQADQTLTHMSVFTEHARLDKEGQLEPDSDRDGLSDELEFSMDLDELSSDTDGDNYSDLFEYVFLRDGFHPGDASAPAVGCDSDRDGDGDGLKDCEEAFIKTDPLQPDSDGDGILDRVELLMGLDPTVEDGVSDPDFDGVFSIDEVFGGSRPLVPDEVAWRSSRILYNIDEIGLIEVPRVQNPDNTDERRCYDYDMRRIPMVITPLVKERGLNRVLVTTSERPSQVSGVPGEVRVACFEAFYNGGQLKNPASGVIDVTPERLESLNDAITQSMARIALCPFFGKAIDEEDGLLLATRSELSQMMDACVPRRIEIQGRLYKRQDLDELFSRHLDAQGYPELPERSFDLFVPIQNYRPQEHCWRPWEVEFLSNVLTEMESYCQQCPTDEEGTN